MTRDGEKVVTFDTGTAAGRAARRAARAEAARAQAASAEASGYALPLDDDFYWSREMLAGQTYVDYEPRWRPPPSSSVGQALTEFVESDYARQVFNFLRVDGADRGQIGGMFETVRQRDGKLELTMTRTCANVEGLVDRIAMYLRARVPRLRGIYQMHKDGMNIL